MSPKLNSTQCSSDAFDSSKCSDLMASSGYRAGSAPGTCMACCCGLPRNAFALAVSMRKK